MTYVKITLIFCLWFAAGYCWGQATAPRVRTQVRVVEKIVEKPVPQGPWVVAASVMQAVDLAIGPVKHRTAGQILPPPPRKRGDAP